MIGYEDIDSGNGEDFYTSYTYASSCAGGSPNGKAGVLYKSSTKNVGTTSGATGFSLSLTMASGTYGKGGDVYCKGYRYSGASGGYNSTTVSVTPGTEYTIVVGNGGSGKTGTVGSTGYYAKAGNSGFVMIQYGG